MLPLRAELVRGPLLLEEGGEDVRDRPDEMDLVRGEGARPRRVGAQHSERPVVAEDRHVDAALHRVLKERLAGEIARLAGLVLDHDGGACGGREPPGQLGTYLDPLSRLGIPGARAGAKDDRVLVGKPLDHHAILDPEGARDERRGFLEDRLDFLTAQRREADLRDGGLLPRLLRHLLFGPPPSPSPPPPFGPPWLGYVDVRSVHTDRPARLIADRREQAVDNVDAAV